jgi:hypothetical protein
MDDKLHRLVGDRDHDADEDFILELNDWYAWGRGLLWLRDWGIFFIGLAALWPL